MGIGEGGGLGEEAEKEGQAWAHTGYLQATDEKGRCWPVWNQRGCDLTGFNEITLTLGLKIHCWVMCAGAQNYKGTSVVIQARQDGVVGQGGGSGETQERGVTQ